MAFLVERCGEMVVSVEPHKPVPAPFLIKTYQLVDDPSTNHIVSWGEDDSTFVVWRPPEFAKDILPNYFKHNNFSSFVRQLNTYGFRKIVAERWEFSNEFFKKGEKHLLSEIHRRKTTQIPQHYHHHHHQQSFHDSPPFQIPNELDNWVEPQMPVIDGGDRTEFLSALSEDNQRLKRRNSLLLSELTHMKKLYTDIIYFIQHHVTPVPPHQRLLADHPPSLSGLHCYKNQDSRIKITEEEPHGDVKLFGVALNGKKLPRMI